MKEMLHPRDLARALFLPLVRVIGGFSLFLAALYLLVGMDPTVPVGNFVVDSVTTSLPLVERLFAVWLLYTMAYLLLGACRQDLWVISLALGRLPKVSRRADFAMLFTRVAYLLIQPPAARFLSQDGSYSPRRIVAGWIRGLSPQLE